MILVKCDKCNDIIEHGKENLIEINYKEKIHLCNECLKKTLIFIKQSKVQSNNIQFEEVNYGRNKYK